MEERILKEVENLRESVENLENLFRNILEILILKSNYAEKNVISLVKKDEKAFKNFMEFVERNKREFLISLLKKKIIERLQPERNP